MTTQPTRPERWSSACNTVRNALEELQQLQAEYQDWRDNIPENMESSPTAEKLDAMADLDLDEIVNAIEEAADADLPRGFGRD